MSLALAIDLRKTLAVYLPSLLSRYSTQVLVISIPWLLQAQGVGLADISAALLPFYEQRGLLSRIDGTGTVETVASRLADVLKLTNQEKVSA